MGQDCEGSLTPGGDKSCSRRPTPCEAACGPLSAGHGHVQWGQSCPVREMSTFVASSWHIVFDVSSCLLWIQTAHVEKNSSASSKRGQRFLGTPHFASRRRGSATAHMVVRAPYIRLEERSPGTQSTAPGRRRGKANHPPTASMATTTPKRSCTFSRAAPKPLTRSSATRTRATRRNSS